MSYDWSFWKQTRDSSRTPKEIYDMLNEGLVVSDLDKIDSELFLSDILAEFKEAYEDESGSLVWEGVGKSFIVSSGEQHVRIDCFGEPGDWMNIFIDIGKKYSCPVYDPQVDIRYDN